MDFVADALFDGQHSRAGLHPFEAVRGFGVEPLPLRQGRGRMLCTGLGGAYQPPHGGMQLARLGQPGQRLPDTRPDADIAGEAAAEVAAGDGLDQIAGGAERGAHGRLRLRRVLDVEHQERRGDGQRRVDGLRLGARRRGVGRSGGGAGGHGGSLRRRGRGRAPKARPTR